MAISTNNNVTQNSYSSYNAANSTANTNAAGKNHKTTSTSSSQSSVAATYSRTQTTATDKTQDSGAVRKTGNYGRTFGQPKLSEAGQKYYEELKKKYGDMDFVLVSADQKEFAKANAGSFANPSKQVVLIDEDKIERMAADENYRKQYEGIIDSASKKLSQMQNSLASSGANVKNFGIKVGADGKMSYFAELEKSSNAQKERIAKKQEANRAQKKQEAKKAEKKQKEQRAEKKQKAERAEKKAEEKRAEKAGKSDRTERAPKKPETVNVEADSMESLMQKIGSYAFAERSDEAVTEAERQVGSYIDFRG